MATKKSGLLTTSIEWAKHLRKYGKRTFWKRERKAASKAIHKSKLEINHEQRHR